jgi:RNA polymerase sigma-54 factor
MPDGADTVIEQHFDLLEREKYKEIARKMKITEEDVHEALEFIRTLTPFPGRKYSTESPRYVIPDLLVTMKEGQFVIVLNDEEIPVLGINPFFDRMNNSNSEQKDVNRFVKSSVKDARWFIHSIQQRNQTLLKVSRAIVEFQRDFFLRGPKYLVPLTLKDIATTVDVHEATVSRITTSKYVQTEWGIFELKYFFSNSISGAGSKGSRYSKAAVKERIREILEEDKGEEKHLSDQRVADLLKQRGITIARRTVAKYRKELDISSSYDR